MQFCEGHADLFMVMKCSRTMRGVQPQAEIAKRPQGEMSTAKCLKLLIKVPRGPLTVTTRDLTLASTSSGIVTDWLVLITFILKSKDKLKSKD